MDGRSPITKVRASAKRLPETDILTPTESSALLPELELRECAMMMVAGSTGLRRSELLALTWSDINLQLMQINVRRSCVRNPLWRHQDRGEPPSRSASPHRCGDAARMESETLYAADHDFVFPSVRLNGKKPLTPDMMLKKWIRPALVRARIRDKVIGWYSFRHSLATNLRAAGVDLKTAQVLLCHANSQITL